jgi:hypothetical protein
VEACQPNRIYLFDLKACGDYGPDSDCDLMVVVQQTTEPGYRLAQQAHSLLWNICTAADILVWSQHAFESRPHLKASLPATIVREGRLLYAGGCTTSRGHRIVAKLKLIQAGFLPWQMCPNKISKSVFAMAYEEKSLNDGYVTTRTARPHPLRAASLDREGFECTYANCRAFD